MRCLRLIISLLILTLGAFAQPSTNATTAIIVNINSPTNYVGSPLINTVYVGTNSGQYFTNFPIGTNVSLVISNLQRGNAYYLVATVSTTNGTVSAYSPEVTYFDLSIPPAPVITATTLSFGSPSITLAWSPVSYSNAPISYTLWWGSQSSNLTASTSTMNTAATVAGLTNGVLYYFSVTATASNGPTSPFSPQIAQTAISGSQGPVTIVVLQP